MVPAAPTIIPLRMKTRRISEGVAPIAISTATSLRFSITTMISVAMRLKAATPMSSISTIAYTRLSIANPADADWLY